MKKYIYLIALLLTILSSCSDDNSEPTSTQNGVAVTGDATEIWALSATIEGKANLDAIRSNYSTVDYGVEYSTETSFQTIIRVSAKGLTGNAFSVQVSKLNPETKYYYRTYVRTNASQNYYQGDIKSFTTNSIAVTNATEIGSMTAVIAGTVNVDNSTSTRIDVEYSTQSSFQEKYTVKVKNMTGRSFNVELSSLHPETKYYYRTSVYLNSTAKTYLGEVKTFTTNKLSETEMYVDLALTSGTLWATMNIGANSPTGLGDEFAWGETAPKNTYSWNTYKWCNGSEYSMTKYCTASRYGTVDNKTELDPEDDAAYVNWGSKWRIPSYDQIYELKNNCTSEGVWLNAVYGILLKSKKNGATIFLPGTEKDYWSRNLYSSSSYAYYFYIYSNVVSVSAWGNRYKGKHIRAVQVSQN